MDETPKYTDLDAEPSRKYTNLDSFQGPAAAPSAAPSLAPTNPAGYPSMDPNSPQAGSAYNGYYQQSPGGSNGYYNGMMPGQPQPRYPMGPQAAYGYPAPSVDQQNPAGYVQQPPHPQQPSYPMTSQQGPVNPQYLAQLHSEIEYYKAEVARMYVMPPSTDLAAKIRDFQTRISYLEGKKEYLAMGSQPGQVAPGYPQSPARYPNPSDPNYMRMGYPRTPVGYPNRPAMPQQVPQTPPGGHYYQNPNQPAGYNVYDNKQQPGGAQTMGYPYYAQNYQMDPNQVQGTPGSHNGYPQAPQYPAQHPSASAGGYQMPQPQSGYQPQTQHSAMNQASQQPHTPQQQQIVRPQSSVALPVSQVQPPQPVVQTPVRPAFSTPSSVAPRASPDQIQSIRPASPRSASNSKLESPKQPVAKSSDLDVTQVNSSIDAALDNAKPITYSPQATSLVSSFVQSAFKSKDENSPDSGVTGATASVATSVQHNEQTLQPPMPPIVDNKQMVNVHGNSNPLPPISVYQPVVSSQLSSPSPQQSSTAREQLSPIARKEEVPVPQAPSFEPCESLIQKHVTATSEMHPASAESQSKLGFEMPSTSVTSPKLQQQESASPSGSSVDNASQPSESEDEPKVFSTLTSHSITSKSEKTEMALPSFSQQSAVPTSGPAHYAPMQGPQPYPVRPHAIPPPGMSSIRPGMHPQPMPVPGHHMPGQYRPEYPMNPGQNPYMQPIPPGTQHMPPTTGQPGMYPQMHWGMPGGAPAGMQPMNGAPAPLPQQAQWPAQHATPPGYPPLAPAGPLPPPRHQTPSPRGGKKSANGKNSSSAEGKRVKKRRKDTEKAIPDSTTSELGEPVSSSNEILSCNEFNASNVDSPAEEPSSSQCDSAVPTTKRGKKRGESPKKPRRVGKKAKDKDHNEAEGIDVSSVELASLEMIATSVDTSTNNSNAETTVELPSPSDVSQSVKKPRRLTTKIGNSKKKRKRFNSSDDEIMLPPEELNLPPEEFMEKRRSERSSARARKNYIADDLIDYALGAGSDDDDETLPADILESSINSAIIEQSTNTASTEGSAADLVESSSCSTVAGTEDSSSQGTSAGTSSNFMSPSSASKSKQQAEAQLLIPAQVETDTCVVEKILISRVRTITKEQNSPAEAVKVKTDLPVERSAPSSTDKAEPTMDLPKDETKSDQVATEEKPETTVTTETSPTITSLNEPLCKTSSTEEPTTTEALTSSADNQEPTETSKDTSENSSAKQSAQLAIEMPSPTSKSTITTLGSPTKSEKGSHKSSSHTSPPIIVTEYFVKFKGLSHLHCEWATEEALTMKDKRFPLKLKRFKLKQLENSGSGRVEDCTEEEPFNPDFTEVDRVLDCMLAPQEDGDSVDSVTGQPKRHFLVKWCSLPYEESTWELEEDIDVQKIQHFFKVNDPKQIEVQRQASRKTRPTFKEWKKLEEMPVFKNNNELRDYQLEGINWLLYCYYKHQNCILADEMGLGKTVQSATFLEMVFRTGIHGPFLVIAPLSTICNWQREFEGWTDQNCIVYHGSQTSRNMIQQYEMFHKDPKTGNLNKKKYKFTALITTYEVLLADCMDMFKDIEWQVCIIDEAHRLKNKKCKLMDGLNMLYLDHIVLLTGTPLQNNVDELFSLLNFLDPNKFCNNQEFLKEFGTLQSEEQVNKLQAILKPLMLRRLKEDVERSIAPKEETIIEVELTNVQKSWYRAIIEKNFSHIAKSTSSGAKALPNLMNTMMELRKCCNHPFLLNGVEEQILHEFATNPEGVDNRYLDALIQSCGKIVLIDKLLPKLKESNHRVLIFSQMVKCLDIIEDYITQRNYSFERIDGGVRGLQRQAAIDRYSKPGSDKFIFLLCTKAGGLGINLTAADTVIIYDSDWNPQNDLQAQARCHRIGQRKHVQVYRLITRNTYEREMFDRASQKLGLDKAVLQTMSGRKAAIGADGAPSGNPNNPMSKKEVEDLLKKGAYGAVMDDEDAAQKFCEEDIDQILKKRTQVIKIESEEIGSTFSKASFTSNDANNDIDLNDPNFWEKWAQKANVDYDQALKDDRIIEEPRTRRQTRRFEYSHVNDDMYGLSDSDSDASGSAESGNGKTERGAPRKHKKKGAGNADDNSSDGGQEFVRSDLYQCEKGLLTYGWGNWLRIIEGCKFRRDMTTKLVEDLCRCILAYALQWYQGDEKIQRFIRELITPDNDNIEFLKSHAAQSSVAPRGRKSARGNKSDRSNSEAKTEEQTHWSNTENLEAVLCDPTFRKHVRYQCNKVLIRVRTLFFIRHEVIDDLAEKVDSGVNYKDLPLHVPPIDIVKPCDWWDETCDKCLFIGIYKHGYDQFTKIRNDPTLCFLSIVGESETEIQDNTLDEDELENDLENAEMKPEGQMDGDENEAKKDTGQDGESDNATSVKQEVEPSVETESTTENGEISSQEAVSSETSVKQNDNEDSKPENSEEKSNDQNDEQEATYWPPTSAINNRLRKLIAALQKLSKKQKLMLEKRKNRLEKLAIINATKPPPEVKEKWAKREENDFYKTISTFGLQYTQDGNVVWDKFRVLASLNRKSDSALTQYCDAFKAMCEKVCRIKIEPLDEVDSSAPQIEPITEDRARKTLHRIELMRRIRLDAIYHPEFEERIKLCQAAMDMPSWWIPGEHDRDLMIGVASHGILRSEVNLLQDPTLCFLNVKDEIMKSVQQKHDEKVAKFKRDRDTEITDSQATLTTVSNSTHENLATEQNVETSSVSVDNEKSEVSMSNSDEPKIDSEKKENDVGSTEMNEPLSEKVNLTEEIKTEISPEVKSEVKTEIERAPSPAPVNITDMLGVAYLVQWPKDRVLVARLEKICTCIENGGWPNMKWNQPPAPVSFDKQAALQETEEFQERLVDKTNQPKQQPVVQIMPTDAIIDGLSANRVASDGSTVCSFNKPGRRGKASNAGVHLPANIRKQSNNVSATPNPIADEKSLSKLRELFEKQGTAMENESPLPLSGGGIGGIMDLSMKAGAGSLGINVPSVSSKYANSERSTPDSRAEDADISDQGSVIAGGSETPDLKRRSVGSSKRKRKHASIIIDPSKLDVDNINGTEHVAVVDRISGVKIEGSDAPILNNVVDFLYKNSTFDIAPEWEVIVKAQKRFPADLMKRVAGLNPGGSPESKKLKQSGKQLYSPARSVSQSASSSVANNQNSGSTSSTAQSANLSSADLLSQAALLSSLSSMGGSSMNPFGSLPNLPPITPDLASLGLFNPMLSMFPAGSQSTTDHKSASSIAAAAAQSAALNYQLASLAAVSLNPLLAQSLNPFSSIPGLNPFGGAASGQDASAAQLAGLSALLSGSLPPGMSPDSLLGSLSQPVSTASATPAPVENTSSKLSASSSGSGNKSNSQMSPKAVNTASDLHSPKSPVASGSASPGNSKVATPPSTPAKSGTLIGTGTSGSSSSNSKSQRSSPPAAISNSATPATAASPVNPVASNLLPNIPQLSPNDLLTAASLGSLPFMMPPSVPFLPSSQSSTSSSSSLNSAAAIPGFDLSAAGLEAAQLAALASLCAGGGIPGATATGVDLQPTNALFGGSAPLYPNSDLSRLSGVQSDSFMNEQNALLARMQKELADHLAGTSSETSNVSSSQMKDTSMSNADTKSKNPKSN